MVFNIDEPDEDYEEELSKEAADIINALNLWKIDEWVAVLYDSTWYPGVITKVYNIIHFPVWSQKLNILALNNSN